MTSADTPRVRRDILIDAQRLAQQIDQAEDELEDYRERDLPGFRAWFEGRFTEDQTRLAELERDLAATVRRHNQMVALAKMNEMPMERAFRMITEEDRAFARGNPATRRHIRDERARREAFLRDDLEREVTERLGPTPGSAPPAAARAADGAPIDAKLTYRRLVRRLHPDVRGEVDCPNELRWQRRVWTLLQAAHAHGDAETLANLYRVTLLRQMDFGELTLDDARDAHAWLSREFEALDAERDRVRGRPAWQFSRAADEDVLIARVREEFRIDAAAVRAEIDEITGQHEYLALLDKSTSRPTGPIEPQPRRPRRGRNGPPSINQLSLFD